MKIPSRKATPEVITGARGPKAERTALGKKNAAKRSPVEQMKGSVVFQSVYANHRIQVTAPPDIKDPFTGRLTQGRPKTAQFRNNILVVKDSDEDTLTWLRSHPKFGVEFWLLADVIAEGKKREREHARNVLADPDQRAALLAELKESGDLDFTLPDVATPEADTELAAELKAQGVIEDA